MLADSPDSTRDLIRRVVGLCADVCEANPHAVAHDRPCGQRFHCPRHGDDDPYRRAELLRNGDLLLHCEGKRLTRRDLGYDERLAELKP